MRSKGGCRKSSGVEPSWRLRCFPMAASEDPPTGALLEDYKLKVAFATDQINRLQTQFQVMLTLQTALATALIVSKSGSLNSGAKWIALLEAVLSLAWFAV